MARVTLRKQVMVIPVGVETDSKSGFGGQTTGNLPRLRLPGSETY